MKSLIPRSQTATLMQPFRQEMEELLQRIYSPAQNGHWALTAWSPRVDVEETDKEVVVKADLPGVDPKDVEITLAHGALILKGEKKEAKEEEKRNYHKVERSIGRFYREIPLPAGADADNIAAASAKGVITVTIAKKPEAQPKRIAIKIQD